MKKIVTVSISILLIFALGVPAFAEGATSFYIAPSIDSAYRGDEIVITVSVSGDNVFQSAGVILSYDTSVFEMVGGSLRNGLVGSFDPTRGFAIINTSGNVYAGEIGTFTLRIKDDAPFSVGNITGTASAKSGNTSFETKINLATVLVKCTHEYDNNCDTECNICGETRQVKHQWDAGEVTHEPTCMSTGVRVYTCTLCGETKAEIIHARGHAYDNDCDTACNTCGTTRTVTHKYSTKWSSDGTGHWHACTVCGVKADAADHKPGAAATEWSAQTCTVCGYELQPAIGHTHKYSDTWVTDEMGHWHECSGCDNVADYTNHSYEHGCDTTCDVCGYVRKTEHIFGAQWRCDAAGHWQECLNCGEKEELLAHVPGPEATVNSNQICMDCSYELAPMVGHTHMFYDEWYGDESGHWQLCDCGTASEKADHFWDEGTVTLAPTATEDGKMTYRCLNCEYERTEAIPAGTVMETEPTVPTTGSDAQEPEPNAFPWWIVIVAGVVLVLGFAAFMIIGAMLGKKKVGKYSTK